VDLLGIKRGTNLSSYTQLWFSFCVSGLMHANAMRTIPAPANLAVADYTLGWIQFFVWQAAAITFEDFAKWSWKRLVGMGDTHFHTRSAYTIIGYMWVTASMYYSLPWLGDLMLRMRLGEQSFLPFSLTKQFVQQLPTPP
jgi:hypothetical protein